MMLQSWGQLHGSYLQVGNCSGSPVNDGTGFLPTAILLIFPKEKPASSRGRAPFTYLGYHALFSGSANGRVIPQLEIL